MIGTNTEPTAPPTLTFLFTGLEGSTRLWQQFPEAMKTALARHDDLVRAAAIFKNILSSQRLLGGKIVALQTATSLCKLEMLRGKADESGKALAKIYNSFTEGFETADLREARSVLRKLQVDLD